MHDNNLLMKLLLYFGAFQVELDLLQLEMKIVKGGFSFAGSIFFWEFLSFSEKVIYSVGDSTDDIIKFNLVFKLRDFVNGNFSFFSQFLIFNFDIAVSFRIGLEFFSDNFDLMKFIF